MVTILLTNNAWDKSVWRTVDKGYDAVGPNIPVI